jgi:hypothetical protein
MRKEIIAFELTRKNRDMSLKKEWIKLIALSNGKDLIESMLLEKTFIQIKALDSNKSVQKFSISDLSGKFFRQLKNRLSTTIAVRWLTKNSIGYK